VIVPHGHERPTRTRILQIEVGEKGAIRGAIIFEISGEMKAPRLLSIRVAQIATQPPAAIQTVRHILGIADNLVDEIAEVQHEAQLLGARAAHVFVDHAPVGIERAVGDVLATDEGETHSAIIA
jgi:hypothetical protein